MGPMGQPCASPVHACPMGPMGQPCASPVHALFLIAECEHCKDCVPRGGVLPWEGGVQHDRRRLRCARERHARARGDWRRRRRRGERWWLYDAFVSAKQAKGVRIASRAQRRGGVGRDSLAWEVGEARTVANRHGDVARNRCVRRGRRRRQGRRRRGRRR